MEYVCDTISPCNLTTWLTTSAWLLQPLCYKIVSDLSDAIEQDSILTSDRRYTYKTSRRTQYLSIHTWFHYYLDCNQYFPRLLAHSPHHRTKIKVKAIPAILRVNVRRETMVATYSSSICTKGIAHFLFFSQEKHTANNNTTKNISRVTSQNCQLCKI